MSYLVSIFLLHRAEIKEARAHSILGTGLSLIILSMAAGRAVVMGLESLLIADMSFPTPVMKKFNWAGVGTRLWEHRAAAAPLAC